ncbi:hypothetical protein [Sphingosinicella humi]|uniref:DUF2158 domain-containing protein n=1 Tax=Allosphingosinicella humi TaxID=2068657 RepID=A0A2U2IZC5_9SPHN|nr:hypothetical protein [Sphingosinicella humi]PWG01436.1 hypothetical protein DF286_00025 [Sphingosinicella humi]
MFTYGDIVCIRSDAPIELRPGSKAWVIGVTAEQDPRGSHFAQFPDGTVYLVEFEGGDAIDVHESMLEPALS